ncbi:MAG TPA: hypothetical protein ENL00_02970 [Nitratifractor sp.]|nr:hypothetical protein [Nitratifractor sp.]HHD74767.1 hypothetical protein [Nitratifractor sp.]
MYTIDQLEKQQVGLRLNKYLIEEIDEFTKQFNVNRSEIITEAIKSYISEQKANLIYQGIDDAFCELADIKNGKKDSKNLKELDEFLDEL